MRQCRAACAHLLIKICVTIPFHDCIHNKQKEPAVIFCAAAVPFAAYLGHESALPFQFFGSLHTSAGCGPWYQFQTKWQSKSPGFGTEREFLGQLAPTLLWWNEHAPGWTVGWVTTGRGVLLLSEPGVVAKHNNAFDRRKSLLY
jgi:hypothetical protein